MQAAPSRNTTERRARTLAVLMSGLAAGALLCALGAGGAARAAEADPKDPPGRVGRIVDVQGNVSRYDHEEDRWSDAERNRPLTGGDRVSTAGGARAELRVGSTTLRLGAGTEIEVLRLDDERMAFQLHSGAVALRVRTREQAAELEVVTAEARLLPLRPGHYRIDRQNETTFAGGWRGELRVDDGRRLTATAGQRIELFRDKGGELRNVWRGMPDDAFGSWVTAEDQRDERQAAARSEYVSPEMTGAEDLDRWGAWDRHPDYGPIWYPREVSAGWAPYRQGRWAWVSPWGWTWVDEARWGFAPFHYGRWVYWGNRWGWSPGTYVARPVYAPALVAWVGGPSFSVSVNIGGPAVGWVPLAPREHYVPAYRVSPVYIDRVNVNPRFGPPGQPGQPHRPTVPTGPVAYTNQGVPGGVTMVPRDVLVRREPVARAIVNVPMPEGQRAPVTVAPAGPPPGRRVASGDDGRGPSGGPSGPDRREGGGPVGSDRRDGPDRRDGAPPRVEPGAPGPMPRVEPAPQTPGSASTVPGRRQDGRDGRDSRDGRDGREGGDRRIGMGEPREGRPARPVQPAPAVQTAPPAQSGQPVQPAPAVRPVQPAPSVQPAQPRMQPVQPVQPAQTPPPAPAVQPQQPPRQVAPPPSQPAPVTRAPQPAPRVERGDDDRQRGGPQPRRGEREREASR
jgi:hypothetical protein